MFSGQEEWCLAFMVLRFAIDSVLRQQQPDTLDVVRGNSVVKW
jgi:hypothetical protein